ncbi:MAG: hypothetical protein AAF380_00265 [Bacteroidota bacterium]
MIAPFGYYYSHQSGPKATLPDEQEGTSIGLNPPATSADEKQSAPTDPISPADPSYEKAAKHPKPEDSALPVDHADVEVVEETNQEEAIQDFKTQL